MDDLSGPAAPLYQQVYDAVMARIISGELAPGVMLPSEFDLAAQYEVSQGTARKALSKLELSGFCLLYTSPSPRDGLLSRMPSSA